MSTYTLPPPDFSGPLSKRAVQILRELQGLRLLDHPTIPTLSDVANDNQASAKVASQKESTKAQPQNIDSSSQIEPVLDHPIEKTVVEIGGKSSSESLKRFHKVAFSRDDYLKDVRGNLIGQMLLAVLLLLAVFGVSISSSVSYVLPHIAELQKQAETIQQIPSQLKSTVDQIAAQTKRRDDLLSQQNQLVSFFPNPQQAYGSYSGFLTLLEARKVLVTGQKSGITQTQANPLLADMSALAEAKKKAEQLPANAKPAAPAPAPKQSMLSGDIKPGLNYYHLEFSLEGSYVGYLAARQALVNDNPNLVVHHESVITPQDKAGVLQITAYMSIPFIHKP
jgi:hypothetical protein